MICVSSIKRLKQNFGLVQAVFLLLRYFLKHHLQMNLIRLFTLSRPYECVSFKTLIGNT